MLELPRRLPLGPDGLLGQNRRKNSSWHVSAVGCALSVHLQYTDEGKPEVRVPWAEEMAFFGTVRHPESQ